MVTSAHRRPGLAALATLLLTLLSAPGLALGEPGSAPRDAGLKAAFLSNFAKFTEWPSSQSAIPLQVCVAGDLAVASALVDIARGQSIGGRPIEVVTPIDASAWRPCHVLFVAASHVKGSASGLEALRTSAVLTVSDRVGFARANGIIELYVEDKNMHFAINVDAATRSGLRLSSRLLGLAKIVRDGNGQ